MDASLLSLEPVAERFRLPAQPTTGPIHLSLATTDPPTAWTPPAPPGPRPGIKNPRLWATLERRRLMASYAYVRNTLAEVLGVPSRGIVIQRSWAGKLYLAKPRAITGSPGRVTFDFATDDDVIGLAIGIDQDVGLDLEVIRPNPDRRSPALAGPQGDRPRGRDHRPLPPRNGGSPGLRTRAEAVAKLWGCGIANWPQIRPSLPSTEVKSFRLPVGAHLVVGALATTRPPSTSGRLLN